MYFTIHSDIALKALNKMCSIFARGTMISLEASDNNLICIGIDSKYCFKCTIPVTTTTPGIGSINLHTLYDLIKHGNGIWQISHDQQQYTLQYANASYKIPIAKSQYDFIPSTQTTWTVNGKSITTIIKDALVAAGDQIYNVVYIHSASDKLTAVATDGTRLSYSYCNGKYPIAALLLNKDTALLLTKWIEDNVEVRFYITGHAEPVEISWTSGEYSYILKAGTLQCNFPEYQKAIPLNGQKITLDGQKLLQALQRIMIFSTNHHVILEPCNTQLIIKSSNIDIGTGSEQIEATFSNDVTSWCIDARMLIPALYNGPLTLEGPANGPIKINRVNSCYVFMPIARSRL